MEGGREGRGTEGEQKGGRGAIWSSVFMLRRRGGVLQREDADLFPGRGTNGGSQPPGPDWGLAKKDLLSSKPTAVMFCWWTWSILNSRDDPAERASKTHKHRSASPRTTTTRIWRCLRQVWEEEIRTFLLGGVSSRRCRVSSATLLSLCPICVSVLACHVTTASYSPYPGRQWAQPGCFSLRCRGYRGTDGPPGRPPAFGPSLLTWPPLAPRSHTPPRRSHGPDCLHPEQARTRTGGGVIDLHVHEGLIKPGSRLRSEAWCVLPMLRIVSLVA